jgi:membrane protein DedA with SNARE-associated domain
LDGENPTPVAPERQPRRGPLALVIAPIVARIACGYGADALWPTLVEEHPLWLLGLSARNRYAVLVVNRVDLWAYYLWGTLRLLLPDPFFFALGWFYGPAALRWMEHRTPTVGTMMRRVEKWFVRWGHPLVFLIPNNYVCLIAGAARMSPVVFALLNVTGTVGRLLVLQIVGDVFSGPIDWFLELVAQYRIPLLVISVVVVAVMAGNEVRRGRKDIEGLHELERGDIGPAGEDDGDEAVGGSDDGRR